MGKHQNIKFRKFKKSSEHGHGRERDPRSAKPCDSKSKVKNYSKSWKNQLFEDQQRLYNQLWPQSYNTDYLRNYKIPPINYSRTIGHSSPVVVSRSPTRSHVSSSYSLCCDLSSCDGDLDDRAWDFGYDFPLINRVSGSNSNSTEFQLLFNNASTYRLNLHDEDSTSKTSVPSPSTSSVHRKFRMKQRNSLQVSPSSSAGTELFIHHQSSISADDDLDIIDLFINEDTSWLEKGPVSN